MVHTETLQLRILQNITVRVTVNDRLLQVVASHRKYSVIVRCSRLRAGGRMVDEFSFCPAVAPLDRTRNTPLRNPDTQIHETRTPTMREDMKRMHPRRLPRPFPSAIHVAECPREVYLRTRMSAPLTRTLDTKPCRRERGRRRKAGRRRKDNSIVSTTEIWQVRSMKAHHIER